MQFQLPKLNPWVIAVFGLAFINTMLILAIMQVISMVNSISSISNQNFIDINARLNATQKPANFSPIYEQISNLSSQYSQDKLSIINNLSNTNQRIDSLIFDDTVIKNRLNYLNNSMQNLTYTFAHLNTSSEAPVVIAPSNCSSNSTGAEPKSCRQTILDKYQLGASFDIVYCCESRNYGFADECCACYR